MKTMEEIMRTYHDTLAVRSKGKEDLIKTDFRSLDTVIRGFKNGELILVFGNVEAGRTAFILQLAANLAVKGKRSVLLFSPENSAPDIARRMTIADSGIRSRDLYKGALDSGKWFNLGASCNIFSQADITVADASYLPLDRLSAAAEKAVKVGKADVILIDSLDHLGYNESAARKVRILKNVALSCSVPVICSCRTPYKVKAKDAYIRKTGEHADIILNIFRELFEERDKSREAYVSVLKNNRDHTGSFIMNFDLDRLIFKEQCE